MHSAQLPVAGRAAATAAKASTVLLSARGVAPERLADLAACASDSTVTVRHLDAAGVVRGGHADGGRLKRFVRAAHGNDRRCDDTLSRRLTEAVRSHGAHVLILGFDPAVDDACEMASAVSSALAQGTDVMVVCDRHARPWRRLLVPYTYGAHDAEAFDLARRLSRRTRGELMLLHVEEPDPHAVPVTVRTIDGCTVRIVRGGDPIVVAEREVSGYDVLVIGGGSPTPDRYFTMRQQRLLDRTGASLVMLHAASTAATFDSSWLGGARARVHGGDLRRSSGPA